MAEIGLAPSAMRSKPFTNVREAKRRFQDVLVVLKSPINQPERRNEKNDDCRRVSAEPFAERFDGIQNLFQRPPPRPQENIEKNTFLDTYNPRRGAGKRWQPEEAG
jgi:hypothetical protein